MILAQATQNGAAPLTWQQIEDWLDSKGFEKAPHDRQVIKTYLYKFGVLVDHKSNFSFKFYSHLG